MNALQTFTCTYGSLNRLTHAVFTQDKYNETLTYYKNGNIQSLQRKGRAGAVYTTIDQLSYAYHGNRLLAVNDLNSTATQAHGFTDNGLLLHLVFHSYPSLSWSPLFAWYMNH